MLIHILMATYNGERFLPEQLASIERQTQREWKLHVRDDVSVDGTWKILERFASEHSGQVELVRGEERLGAKDNFAWLLRGVREAGDYVFCDQDDIWEPEKLELLQKKLRESEKEKDQKENGLCQASVPALVYSDAVVIDENGELTAPSFAEQTGIPCAEDRVMEHLLLCNFVQGAAAMWNQSLHEIVSPHPVPGQALMHDWWLALVAAGHGRIVFLPQKLIRYRQHPDNVLGGFDRGEWHRTVRRKLMGGRIRRLVESNRQLFSERREQAEAYQRIYGDRRADRYLEIAGKRPKCYRAYLGIREGYIFLSKIYSLKYYLL